MKAVNDSLLLENCVELLLRQELNNKSCFAVVTRAFHEVSHFTIKLVHFLHPSLILGEASYDIRPAFGFH